MSKTRRLTYRLQQDEALLLGPVENFKSMIDLFEALSRMREYSADHRQAWSNCADWVREWLGRTEYHPEEPYDG